MYLINDNDQCGSLTLQFSSSQRKNYIQDFNHVLENQPQGVFFNDIESFTARPFIIIQDQIANSVEELLKKVSNKTFYSSDQLKLARIVKNKIEKLFQNSDILTQEDFEKGFLVIYPTPVHSEEYISVSLFDSDVKESFGCPFLVAKPEHSSEIQPVIKEKMVKYLITKSDKVFGQKLTKWSSSPIPFVDLTDTSQQQDVTSFYVKKDILIKNSPVFQAMLASPNFEESMRRQLILKDIRPKVIKELLWFLYHDDFNNIDEILFDTFIAADKYLLTNVKQRIAEHICSKRLGQFQQNIMLVSYGAFYNCQQICKHGTKMILKNYQETIKTEEWQTFVRAEPKLARKIEKKSKKNRPLN
jgi:hypothetical protein